MRILIFAHEFPPRLGGAGIVASVYAKELQCRGHTVEIVTKYDRLPVWEFEGIKVHRVPTLAKIPWVSYCLYFFRKRNSLNFDLFILNDPVSVIFASIFFSVEKLNKCCVFLHGSEPENIFRKNYLASFLFRYKKRFCLVLEQCRSIVAVSNFMKYKFLNITNLHNLSHKIDVHYTPVDRSLYGLDVNCVDSSGGLGRKVDCITLLTVSRIVRDKGFESKVNIFENLVSADANTKWRWVIVGDGPYLKELMEMVKVKKMDDYIKFLGAKSHTELREIYESADIFWLLSNFDESYGLVYKEAQACGCPVIGRNRAGVRECIKQGVNGFLVNSDQECINILIHRDFMRISRCELKASSRQEKFTFLDSQSSMVN